MEVDEISFFSRSAFVFPVNHCSVYITGSFIGITVLLKYGNLHKELQRFQTGQ